VVLEVKNDSAPFIAFKQRHTPDDKLTVVNQFATLNQKKKPTIFFLRCLQL